MEPKLLMTEVQMDQELERVAKEIISDDVNDIALVGIRTRGVPVAEWLNKKIEQQQGKPLEMGVLDINLYRDDLSEVDEQPIVKPTELPFKIDGKGIILVDDVLYTGRTIRAAMDAIIDYGRPKFIRLMVMVDRGWREFPIQADYIAKKIDTAANENVKVMLSAMDETNQILVKTMA